MRIEKITMIDDKRGRWLDSQYYPYQDFTEFRINAKADDVEILITLTGEELNELQKLVRNKWGGTV